MTKLEYFLKALREGAFKRKHWVLSVFSVTLGKNKETYPYMLVRKDGGVWVLDPDVDSLVEISDAKEDQPLFSFKEPIVLNKGDLVNVGAKTNTTVGIAYINQLALVNPFHDKIPFQNGELTAKGLERFISLRLLDNPEDGVPKPGDANYVGGEDSPIYVEEYLTFTKAMFSLVGYTQLCVPAATPKALTTHPDMAKLKKRLLEENKDRLHDPAVIAKIESELIALDREWLKDDESMGFYIDKKSIDLKRKKMHSMMGAQTGFQENANDTDLVTNALSEGWDINKIPAMMDSLREGSYSRGKETAKGGESVKFFMRVFQNTKVGEQDCKSTLGRDKEVSKENYKKLEGFYELKNGKVSLLTDDYLKTMIGKTITVRSPMYCLSSGTNFCATCVGEHNAENPKSLVSAISSVGSTFMLLSMGAAHAKSLETSVLDIEKAIS